jgi:hypothetical protein
VPGGAVAASGPPAVGLWLAPADESGLGVVV